MLPLVAGNLLWIYDCEDDEKTIEQFKSDERSIFILFFMGEWNPLRKLKNPWWECILEIQ